MNPPRVVVFSRAGCHLCDVAEQVVEATLAATDEDWQRIDLDGPGVDPQLRARLTDKVPVVTVDGKIVAHWRISPGELTAALRRH